MGWLSTDGAKAVGTLARALRAAAILVPTLVATLCGAQEVTGPVVVGNAIVLENKLCRYEIGTDGKNRAFVSAADKQDYCAPGQPFMVAGRSGKSYESSSVALNGALATVCFGDSGVSVVARLEAHVGHFAVTIEQVCGEGVEWVRLCNLRLKITKNVGTLVNAAWDDAFGACVLACNDLTDSVGADNEHAALLATCYQEYGMKGARVAIIGAPTGGPEPAGKVLDAIGEVEIVENLPHPTLNGVWIKRAPERFASYLMVNGLTEANVDQVIQFARGGFGCVEMGWWHSTPSYAPNEQQFPHGLVGMKTVADKIHAAGMQVGLHCMQGMVGWGAKDEPYISPKADPRLLQDPRGTLAEALDLNATRIALAGGTKGWPEQGDLCVEGEIIRYQERADAGFERCQRGLWGTTVAAHPAGVAVGNLVNCFPIWGHTVYAPDIKTSLVDEICDRLALVFTTVGADMSYFDGGEEIAKQPPHWHNQGRFALEVQARLHKPLILEGNAMYTHLAWHVISRGSPDFDPIYFGRREYTLRFKGTNPAHWAKNLLTGDVGWFAPHTHSAATDAVTPDEVMLLCLKALGGKSPISFQVDAGNLNANKRMPEMLQTIRACDALKRRDYFTEAACQELTKPGAEYTLERRPDGEWDLRALRFGPPRVVNAAREESAGWKCANPYGAQAPWVRIRARTQLAAYGAKENVVLADFDKGVGFKAEASASPELKQSVEPSTEKTPDGGSAFSYRVENTEKGRSGWCKIALPFAKPLDLTKHRRLGLWVRSEGQGGMLNLQLTATDARRDHYIPLDFSGWKYVELVQPEESRVWDYKWPYSWTDLFYTCWGIYNATKELDLYYNDLPAGAKVTTLIGRIEALNEAPLPLVNPKLEAGGQTLAFPATLKPDEYLEMDWSGTCQQYDADGGVLGVVKPVGQLRLATGDDAVRFACEGGAADSSRAEVTLALRDDPLPNARRPVTATGATTAAAAAAAQQKAAGNRTGQGQGATAGGGRRRQPGARRPNRPGAVGPSAASPSLPRRPGRRRPTVG